MPRVCQAVELDVAAPDLGLRGPVDVEFGIRVFLDHGPQFVGVRGATANARLTGEEEGYDAPELLIGWGCSVDANLLCWRAEDPDPDRWTTVVFGAGDGWTELDCGMVEVLCRWATNRIPYFAVEKMDLPYVGSRFLGEQDEKRLRQAGVDPWGIG